MTENISGRYAFVVNYLVVFSLDHVQSANTTGGGLMGTGRNPRCCKEKHWTSFALSSGRYNIKQDKCVPSGPAVVGFAMYYFTYDPWVGKQLYLEDFYVMKPYRGAAVPQSSPQLLLHR